MKKIFLILSLMMLLIGCQKEETTSTYLSAIDTLSEAEVAAFEKYNNVIPSQLNYFEADKGTTTINDKEEIESILSTILGMKIGEKVEDLPDNTEKEFIFVYAEEDGEAFSFIISNTDGKTTIYNGQDGKEYEIIDDNGLSDLQIEISSILSFEEATAILINYDEIQDNLKLGMDFMDGDTMVIDEEEVRSVNMGTNSQEQFVVERQYVVYKNGDVKYYDVLTDEWIKISVNG